MPNEGEQDAGAAGIPAPGDYGYDLAHEAQDQRGASAPTGTPPPVYVPTESEDTEEDLGYDLAHDIPRDPGR